MKRILPLIVLMVLAVLNVVVVHGLSLPNPTQVKNTIKSWMDVIGGCGADIGTILSALYGAFHIGKGVHEGRRYGSEELIKHVLFGLLFLIGLPGILQWVKHAFGLSGFLP